MTINIGEKIPEFDFKIMGEAGPEVLAYGDIFAGKKVVLFAVPGAFTPTCHSNHLPGFLENLENLKAKGVDEVAVLAVNDPHVLGFWAELTNGAGKIKYLSDGNAEFTKAIGMDIDLSIANLGVRSKRYSMIIEDGTVTALNVEEAPGKVEKSGAAGILSAL